MITVFGSTNMDLVAFVWKAPKLGETITGRAFHAIPGGKGANQAIAAARAGAEVAFIGAVGDDGFGPQLRDALSEAGVDTSVLRVMPGSSGVAHILVEDGGGNSIVVVPGANATIGGPTPRDADLIAASDALLLQLELPLDAVVGAAGAARAARTARRAAGAADVEVILTPAPVVALPDELLDAVDVLVPNEHEAAAITGLGDPEKALDALVARVPEAVVTLGAKGALYGSRDGVRLWAPAVPVPAVDTTAAGDTFVGALAVARAEGRGPEEALRFASAAAALSVQREGASTSMPYRSEIDAALSRH